MEWKKPSATLGEHLAQALVRFDCERKMMFGAKTYFVKGNMFAGVHGDGIFIRLSEQDRGAVLSAYGEAAPFEPVAGRVMKEYIALPPALIHDADKLDEWLERSYRYMLTLPVKEQKPKRKKG
jgi:TfoX/Sxy family transcriptional regulator of competence genes